MPPNKNDLLHSDRTIDACAVMDLARHMLTDPKMESPDAVLNLINHELTEHLDPPVELSPAERDRIKLAVATTYALSEAIKQRWPEKKDQ